MRGRKETVRLNRVLPRIEAPAEHGLSRKQAKERLENGYSNAKPDSAEKTVLQIFKDNIFTYFNMILTLLAVCLIIVGSFADLAFYPIVIINTMVGIVQELRSKRMLAKLSIVSAPNAAVIRDGGQISIPSDETVLDDIVLFGTGQQIYADAIVISGECQVNEALVTGESDEIAKAAGDTLLSGSFIISGECTARLDKVGSNSFVAQLMVEAKKTKNKLATGMTSALRKLILIIGIAVLPLGVGMLLRQMQSAVELTEAIRSTVGGLVGMIPNGLYMLVSVTLTVSVIRLLKRRTLIQDRNCVETLARVDVLCVDKTGTITENKMEVKEVALLCPDNYNSEKIRAIMLDYAGNMNADNETMVAVHSFFGNTAKRRAAKVMPFSSAVKYGGMSFSQNESYLFGAPERILGSRYAQYRKVIEAYSAQGYRVLLLAQYDKDITGKLDESRLLPIAIVMLSNKVRDEAPATFRYFAQQGVKIIVISGDNPVTVSHIAKEAGIEGAEHYVDAVELQTDRQIKRAVGEYTIFGRVTPDQKRKLVRALKLAGYTVAMTGDGVNDVLALKESDCSIAMASGSEVTSQVSDIVLLDSDFSALPSVVMEGRRVINNIQRCATLYMSKNISAFLFAIVMVIAFGNQFPLTGSQYMPYELFLIGIPSYFIALQSSKSIVKGKFLTNVLRGALPIGVTVFLAWTAIQYIPWLYYETIAGNSTMQFNISTMSNIAIALAGWLLLLKLSLPLNKMRGTVLVSMALLYILSVSILGESIFHIMPLHAQNILTTVALGIMCVILVAVLTVVFEGRNAIELSRRGRRPRRSDS